MQEDLKWSLHCIHVYISPLQLVEACRTGDVGAVQQLLLLGVVDVNATYDEEVCT